MMDVILSLPFLLAGEESGVRKPDASPSVQHDKSSNHLSRTTFRVFNTVMVSGFKENFKPTGDLIFCVFLTSVKPLFSFAIMAYFF
jgi:hypothetical protein